MNRGQGQILATALAAVFTLGGCANRTADQAWSTKRDSMLGMASDAPALNLPEPPPPSASVSEMREPAISLLIQASESTNPLLRAHAIEMLRFAPERVEPILQRGVADENRGVRFAAAMMVGRLKLQGMAPFVEPLLHDESQSVQAAAIYAMRRCGRKVDLNPLATMLLSENPEIKGNAALVLGELGDPTATNMLRNSIGRSLNYAGTAKRKVVELQIAEAMVKLGASSQIEFIRAALFAPPEEAELVALACQMCGEVKDAGAVSDLLNLTRRGGQAERPAEIKLAAAQAVAEIEPSRAPIDVPLGYVNHARYDLRAQAVQALGTIYAETGGTGGSLVVEHLARLLTDPNALVQVAAAGAIVRASQHQSPAGF